MQQTITDVLRTVTGDCLSKIDPNNPPSCDVIEGEILSETRNNVDMINTVINVPRARLPIPQTLVPQQIAEIINHLFTVRRIPPADGSNDSSYDMIAIYCKDGPDAGLYVTDEEIFDRLARLFKYDLKYNEFKEVMRALRSMVPRAKRTKNPNLVPVNNGIFDYDTKTLLPFSPDYVFLSKCRVNYNPNAVNVNIHNPEDNTDWNVEDWMFELSDDKDVTNLLWQILGATIRPYVNWNKAAWFYSTTGNNGKGTLCELMRELVGEGSYASVSLSDMNKDFALESLIHSTSVIVDENDVGTYIDKAANLKALITHDVVQINRKFKQMIPFRFHGFMVQCLNEMPRVKDKSDSFYRRQIFIPFKKTFTGRERKYIKNDYLHRKEVLEYVLYKVLNMDYYDFDVPDSCLEALEEYKKYNDPILEFVDEILPELKWERVPHKFLYELYCSWYVDNYGKKDNTSNKVFTRRIREIVLTGKTDFCLNIDEDGKDKAWSSTYIKEPEPMIETYHLINWMNPLYKDRGPMDLKCMPIDLANTYRGIVKN